MENKIDDKQYIIDVEKNASADPESAEDSVSVSESASTFMSSPGRKQLMMAVNSSLQSIDPLSLLKPVQQAIHCTGDDDQSSFSIYGNDVSVFPCEYDKANSDASSKIRISQVCKFDWEQRYYFGDLVASNKTYVAYVVGVKTSRDEHVRVINHHTSSRVLLKGFDGKVTDIRFGGPEENHLACMDTAGNLRVFLLAEDDSILKYDLLLDIQRNEPEPTEFCLVSWAPSIIDEDNDEDEPELMVAVTYKDKADVFSINTIIERHGNNCLLKDVVFGRKSVSDGHTKPITQLVISPNLEVLATSSLDGRVKVWDINFEKSESPSCLHEWQPHDGEPVTALFFCDNHLSQEEGSSWRFLITGAKYNTELKVWCSVSWKCLQVLRFGANPQTNISEERNPFPRLKPLLDKSALFFILSDVKRQVLYLLQLYQNSQEGTAHFTSLTECILAQPMLSYSLYHTKATKKSSRGNEAESENGEDGNDEDDDHNGARNTSDFDHNGAQDDIDHDDVSDMLGNTPRSGYLVSLKMFGIHVKSLQKLHIRYSPYCSVPPPTPSVCTAVSSEDHMSARDAMSDITEGQSSLISDLEDTDSFATANLKPTKMDESVHSNSSSITTVTAVASAPVTPQRTETQSDAVERINGKEEQKTDVNLAEDYEVLSEGEIEKSASVESNRSSIGASIDRPKSGTFTILKRPTQATRVESAADDDQESLTDNQKARKQILAELGITSPERSEKLPETARRRSSTPPDTERIGRAGATQVEDRKEVSLNKKSSEDIDSPRVSVSQECQDDVMTGDLLGLGLTENVPDDEKRSMSKQQDNIQPIGIILKMLQDQQKHITQLTKTVEDLSLRLEEQAKQNEASNKAQTEERDNMKVTVQLMQKNSGSNLNKAVKEISKACSQRLDSFSASVQTNLLQSQDRQMQALLQAVNNSITGKLDKILKSEVKASILPSMQKLVGSAMDQVTSHVTVKLAAIEKTLREEVSIMVKSKAVAESIGFTAATILEGTLPNAYREAFENVLIPSYERACKEMFGQINQAFEKGTKAYFDKMDGHFESRKKRQMEMRDPVLNQLQGLVQTFQDTADRLTGTESNLEVLMRKQIADVMVRFKSELLTAIDQKISQGLSDTVKGDMTSLLNQLKDDLNAAIQAIPVGRSGAVAGENIDEEDIMDGINKNLEEYDYHSAFEVALTAADLNLVLFVCQKVDPDDLFTKNGSALSQPILLSLIQQLSVDLTNDTSTKVNYLQEAITALDQTNEITAEHMSKVLESLMEQVTVAMDTLKMTDPDGDCLKQLKYLSRLTKITLRGAS